jgi:hypothetical protein
MSDNCMRAAVGCLLILSAPALLASVPITIVVTDAAGVGFNDPTPAAPVGGNAGTTIGQQRLIAFQYAASIWGNKLNSTQGILMNASFPALSCNATSAVLGSAGPTQIWRGFPNAEIPNVWYPVALANKLANVDLASGVAQIIAQFNRNLGNTGCLTGNGWYYGLDNHAPANRIDLATVLLHEFAHGLGFIEFASVSTGAQVAGFGDVWGQYLLDNTTGKTWNAMTNAERAAASVNPRHVVWTAINVTKDVPTVLQAGTPLLRVSAPSSIAGSYSVGTASFGASLASPGVTGQVVVALDPANASGPSITDACSPLTNGSAVFGKIALADRGTCSFVVKAANAQAAGAIALIIADNVAGAPPSGLGGTDSTITIPAVRISLADGVTIKTALLSSAVTANLGLDLTVRAGADAAGRALLYTPSPVQPGSSVSHWDTIATPNQLMEPNINSDLTHSVQPPQDLTLSLMRDIGWFSDFDGVPDGIDQCPGSDLGPTIVIQGCDTGVKNATFSNGCRISDFVKACAAAAKNNGAFTSCVAAVSQQMRQLGAIAQTELGKVQSCAAAASIP